MAVQDIAKHDYCFLICFQLLSKLYRARYKTNITKDFLLRIIKIPPGNVSGISQYLF
jgi:hypothetical protein